MEKSVFGSVRGLMIAMALSVMVIFGCAMFVSDDSYAANEGNVVDQNGDVVGTFSYGATKLTLTTTASDEAVTSLDLPSLDLEDRKSVTTVIFDGFSKDYRDSFTAEQGYTKSNIGFEYHGIIKSNTTDVGKWTFIPDNGTLSLVANSLSTVDQISFTFNMKESVTTIEIKLFAKNLIDGESASIVAEDYPNLDLKGLSPKGLFYVGDIYNNKNLTGKWFFNTYSKDVTVQHIQNTTALVDDSSSLFNGYYFVTEAKTVKVLGYTYGGNYLFKDFSNATEYYSDKYSSNNFTCLFYGMSSLTQIQADGMTSVHRNFFGGGNASIISTFGGTLKKIILPYCTGTSSQWVFSGLNSLVSVEMPLATAISEHTFNGCKSLKEVTMPLLTSIGYRSFYSCESLTNISFDRVTSTSSEVFYGCISLTDVDLPKLAVVQNNSFQNCSVLTNVNVPTSTTIGTSAFQNCISLEKVVLGDEVVVYSNAFYSCVRLNDINVGGIKSLGTSAFYGCTSLNGPREFKNLTTFDSTNNYNSAFKGCGIEEIKLPKVEKINDYAFYGSSFLTSVEIGPTCGSIGYEAFRDCSKLSTVMLHGGNSIGGNAFYACSLLNSIEFPDSLQTIGNYAFYGSGLTSINTNNVVSIGSNAFNNCISLSNVTFGPALETIGDSAFVSTHIEYELVFNDKLTSVGKSAFYKSSVPSIKFSSSDTASKTTLGSDVFNDCDSLTSVSFGKQVSVIPYRAFYNCNLLEDVVFGYDSVVTSIGQEAFSGCIMLKSAINLPKCLETLGTSCFYNTSIDSLSFDKDCVIKTIPASAFNSCYYLRSVNIPASVTNIDASAFSGDRNLQTLELDAGSKLEVIGNNAFYGCTSLISKVTFPASVTTIGNYAFYSCGKITGIGFEEGSQINTIGSYSFDGCKAADGNLLFPSTLVAINAYAFRSCAELDSISFDACINLETIGVEAFSGCKNMAGKLSFGNKLTTLGTSAFYGCTSITGVKFAEDSVLETIGSSAFNGCTSITELKFAENSVLKTIGSSAFNGCKNIVGPLKFPNSIVTIGSSAFNSCSSLVAIEFDVENSMLNTIGTSAFNSCKLTGALNLPNRLVTIEGSATWSCTFSYNDFESVTFGTSLKTIGLYTFSNCNKIKGTLTIPSSVESIGIYAFYRCTSLTGIEFQSDSKLTNINDNAFQECSNVQSVTSDTFVPPDDVADPYTVTMGARAFISCSALTYFKMNGVTVVGNDVFDGCRKLTHLELAGASTIPASAIDNCTLLEYIDFGSISQVPNNMFKAFSKLVTVDVHSATTIGSNAFKDLAYLKTVNIDSAVTIDAGAFSGCVALNSITSSSAKDIGAEAFLNCSLMPDLNSYSNLETIGANAFSGCVSINGDNEGKIVLPEIISLGVGAFNGCRVVSFELGPNLVSLGANAINNVTLKNVVIHEDNATYMVKDGIVYSKSLDILYLCPAQNTITSVVLPGTVRIITDYAFIGTANIKSVEFPTGTYLQIGAYAFSNSSIRGSLVLPDNVASLGEYAFYNCTGISDLTINCRTADVLGAYAFSGCGYIESLTIPFTVKLYASAGTVKGPVFDAGSNITNYVFMGAGESGLGSFYVDNYMYMPWYSESSASAAFSVTFDSGILKVDPFMFYNPNIGTSKLRSVSFADTVEGIGNKAFFNCSDIRTLSLSKSLKTLGTGVFNNCTSIQSLRIPINIDATTLGVKSATITKLEFIAGTTSVGFNYKDNNYQSAIWADSSNYSVTFENGITSIGNYMCLLASGTLSIPSSVTSIGEKAFYRSTINNLVIVDGLTSIGNEAFGGCEGLQSITLPNTLTSFTGSPFKGCISLRSVYLPISVDYSNPMFSGCNQLREFVFTPGTGVGAQYTSSTALKTPWHDICGLSDYTVTFQPGITSIGAYTFYQCVAVGISGECGLNGAITLPDSVTSVGDYAFCGSHKISSVDFGSGLREIGEDAFKGCVLIDSLELNDRLTSIGAGAFGGCVGITDIVMPINVNAVASASNPIFGDCTGLTSIRFTGALRAHDYTLDASDSHYQKTPWYFSRNNTITVTFDSEITSIGTYMFAGCTGLHGALVVPETMGSVGAYAFSDCSAVSSIEIRNASATLGANAFKGCTSVNKLTIPISVNAVGSASTPVFQDCTGITRFEFTGIGKGCDYSDIHGASNNYQGTPWYASRDNGIAIVIGGNITGIGNNMFRGCTGITGSISFDAPIVSIGNNAFDGVTSLKEISVLNKDIKIGEGAFRGCTGVNHLTIPITMDAVGSEYAPMFEGCTGLKNISFIGSGVGFNYTGTYDRTPWAYSTSKFTVSFADTITGIGTSMFRGCTGLGGTINKDSLTVIGDMAFKGCTSLDGFIGMNVTDIGESAFEGCKIMSSVGLPKIKSVPVNSFKDCNGLISATITEATSVEAHAFENSGIRTINSGSIADLSKITRVGDYAFARSSIVSIVIGSDSSSITYFGDYALLECQYLTSVDIRASLNNVPYNTFRASDTSASFVSPLRSINVRKAIAFSAYLADCFGQLETVSLPTTTDLKFTETEGMFKNCVSLKSFTISSEKVTLPRSAFEGCSSLTTIDLSNFKLEMGREFYGCTSLNGVTVTVPSIPEHTFYGCSKLVTFSAPNATVVKEHAFDGTGFVKIESDKFPVLERAEGYAFANNRSLSVVNLPTLKYAGEGAFENCNTMYSVLLPALEAVSDRMFYGDSSIDNISVDSAKSIGIQAFYGCSYIAAISMASVESIGDTSGATYTADKASDLGVFVGCSTLKTVTMPNVTAIGAFAFYGCNSLVGFNGSGVAELSGVTHVGYGAFVNTSVSKVTLGSNSVTSYIGDTAFSGCTSLKEFVLKGGLESFGKDTFARCTLLEKLTIPISVNWTSSLKSSTIVSIVFTAGTDPVGFDYSESEGTGTLWSASKGYTVTFENGITSIGDNMVLAPTGTLSLPSSMRYVKEKAFYGAPINGVLLNDGLLEIHSNAFGNCPGLRTAYLPDSLEVIGDSAFGNCVALNKVTLPITTDYSADVFNGCTALKDFNFTKGTDGVGVSYTDRNYTSTPWYLSGAAGSTVTVTFGSGIVSIGDNMFRGCTALSGTLVFGPTIASIGVNAFNNAIGLTDVQFQATNVELKKSSFKGCAGIESITIPAGVNTVVDQDYPAFEGCRSITSVRFTGVGEGYSYGESGNNGYAYTPWYQSRLNNITVTFDDTITGIGDNMFRDCIGLSGTVVCKNAASVGANAFSGCTSLVEFESSALRYLGSDAFKGDIALESVAMSQITELPAYTFAGCSALTYVYMPACKIIGAGAFESSGIKRINDSVSIDISGVINVGDRAFAYSAIESITIGNSSINMTLGDRVLLDCPYLRNVSINGKVNNIPKNTFCDSNTPTSFTSPLVSVTADNAHQFSAVLANFTSLRTVSISGAVNLDADNSRGMFMNCTALTTVVLYTGSSNTVIMPASMFEGCTSLVNVDLSRFNLNAGREFYGCTSLTTVSLPLTSKIPGYSFYGCTDLTSVTAPRVSSLGEYAFAGSGLTAIDSAMFGSLTTVGNNAFESCKDLLTVDLSNVSTTGDATFKGCGRLTSAVLPKVQEIGTSMFYECTSLVTVSADDAERIMPLAFFGCRAISEISMENVRDVGDISASSTVTLDDYVTRAVFYSCVSLTKISLPNIQNVGILAFYGCTSVDSFNGDGKFDLSNISSIRFGAFAGSGAKSVTIGKTGGISEIGDYAFYGCSSLETFESVSLRSLPEHLFNGKDVSERSLVPMFVSISVPAVITFNANLHGCTYLTEVNAPSAVSFCENTFYGCSNLTKVTLLSNEESGQRVLLSTRMFYGCERLSSIDLTNALLDGGFTEGSVGETFKNCKALKSITLPVATKIPSGAFQGCIVLSEVNMPQVTDIGSDAFNGCVSLVIVNAEKVLAVYDRAFLNCSNLSKFNSTVESSPFVNITSISSEAFRNCKFSSVILGPNLLVIGEGAFANNPITELVVPNSPSGSIMIGSRAFQGCPLEEIHLSSSVSRIERLAFDFSMVNSLRKTEIWFNGTIGLGMLQADSILCNGMMSLVIHADPESKTIVESFESRGWVKNPVILDYVEASSVTISLQTTEAGTPGYNTVTAVYGGKIVLPFINYGSASYGFASFATLDSQNTYLSLFDSDASFDKGDVAKSGDAVPIYPLVNLDSMVFVGVVNYEEMFVNEMTIETNASAEVDITSQTVHYGGEVKIPKFYDPLMKLTGLSVIRDDGIVYTINDLGTTSFRAGYYLSVLVVMSGDTTIEVVFVSKGDLEVAEVKIQSPFQVPTDLLYMQNADAGYEFGGWWTSEGGKGIKAGEDTKFAIGQRWYAYFIPKAFNVDIYCDDPEYSQSFEVMGPYTLHVINGSLYYTDSVNTSNKLVFDGKSIPGYSVSMYTDKSNYGRVITGDYGPITEAMSIDLFMTMNNYTLTLKFTYGDTEIPSTESFLIDGWTVGQGNTFKTGDVISEIPYSQIQYGLAMPIPVNNDYAFSSMKAGPTNVQYSNGKYTLTLDNFSGQTSVVINYIMTMGQYTIRFVLNDDMSTSFTNSEPVMLGSAFTMPSVVRNYSKTGYVFDCLKIDGMGTRYSEREQVILTQEMIDTAVYCVITVNAIWNPISYNISFDLTPYSGTLPVVEGVIVGQELTLPVVTGYSGYKVAGWTWILGEKASDMFSDTVVFEQSTISEYADGINVTMRVVWAAKSYTIDVDPSTGYKFETLSGTYGEKFTLWTNNYVRSFMKFEGWSVGGNVYGNGASVTLDSVMAAAGDANDDKIVFTMSWINNRYQVQYNLDGGEGQIPVDDGAYIVNSSEFILAPASEAFYKDGYSFVGWKYSKDSYIVYTNTTGLFEPVLAQNADASNLVTFYAVWSQKSYKISYNLDGGRSGLNAPTNVLYGDEITISNPTRAGYTFAGWTAEGLTSGALYSSSAGYRGWDGTKHVTSLSFMDLCNVDGGVVTMTAHWELATYLVSYDFNGGNGIVIGGQNQIKVGEVIVQPNFRDATKTGYVYIGWGVDRYNALEPGAIFSSDMISEDANTLMLYAVWTPIEYNVEYRYSADYSYTTLSADYDSIVTIPSLTRAGYTFNGWKITGAGSNAYYSVDGNVWYRLSSNIVDAVYFKNLSSTNGNTVTLEADWTAKEYRIAYNTNGGTGKAPIDSNIYKVGDKVTLKDYTALSGTNGSKIIVGWSLDSAGSAITIIEFTEGLANVADATGAVNLYGVWKDDMCSVIVDLGSASPSAIPAGWVENQNGTFEKVVNHGMSTKDVMADWDGITISLDGYNFIGWAYTSATITTSVTVTPNFEEVNMSILYVFGGVVATFVVGALVFTRF